MAKVGRFVSDPRAGSYCDVVLDNGDKLLVNHSKGGFKGGWLTIEKRKWLGSEELFRCDLDSDPGKAVLLRLTRGASAGSLEATPLYAFVEFIRECKSAEDVKARCVPLLAGG